MTVTLDWADQSLTLLPDRAALLADAGLLLVADVHIGKAMSFRRRGVPVPRGTTDETLEHLTQLLEGTGARALVILGDFLHSADAHAAATFGALARWRRRHAGVAMTLVRGNHDDRAGDPPPELGVAVVDEPLQVGGIALCHHPRPRSGSHVLAGHLHPCVSVGGRANDRLRLPCFHFAGSVGVLPAFGAFTGMHPVRREPEDRVFAVTDEAVVAVP